MTPSPSSSEHLAPFFQTKNAFLAAWVQEEMGVAPAITVLRPGRSVYRFEGLETSQVMTLYNASLCARVYARFQILIRK